MGAYSNSADEIERVVPTAPDVWKTGLLTEEESLAQLRSLPPGIAQAEVDAAFDSLGGRVDKLSIKRALFAALKARPSTQ